MNNNTQDPKAQTRFPATTAQKMAWQKALLRQTNLSQGAKNVSMALLMFHNQATGQCNPSQARLGDAVGLGRKRVNRLIAELVSGGWIETFGTLGASQYRLMIDRAADISEGVMDDDVELEEVSPIGDRGCPHLATGGVPISRQGVSPFGDTELSEEPSKGTIHPNQVPTRAVEERPADAPEIPEQPVNIPPVLANDDDAGLGVVMIGGLKIPTGSHTEWETTFADINLRAEILRLASWASGLPIERRFKSLQTKLSRMNEEARQARLDRKDSKIADAAAGVERCMFTGRPKGAKLNPRYQIL